MKDRSGRSVLGKLCLRVTGAEMSESDTRTHRILLPLGGRGKLQTVLGKVLSPNTTVLVSQFLR